MKRFILAIRLPLVAEVINSGLAQVVGTGYGIYVFPLITAVIVFWAGVLITREAWGSLAHAGWAGPTVLFCGVLVTGMYWVISSPFGADELRDIPERAGHAWAFANPRLAAFSGLVMSSAMFTPIAALISALGGLIAKRLRTTGQ